MKICYTFNAAYKYSNGGAETWGREFGRELASRGHEVVLSTRYFEEDQPEVQEEEGVKIISYGPRPSEDWNPLQIRKDFMQKIWRENADVYWNACYTHLTGLTALVAKARRSKFIYSAANNHEVDPEWRKKLSLNRRISGQIGMRLADKHVSYSRKMHEKAKKQFPGPDEKFEWFYHGHPVPEVDLEEDKEKIVLWLASFEREWKKPELFLDIAEKVEAEDWRFCLAGTGPEEKMEKLRERASEIENAEILGFVEDDTEWYRKASIFVSTSDKNKEGFPNAFIQSVVAGTPVASRHNNPDNLLTEKGLGTQNSGTDELAEWIQQKINNDSELKALQKKVRKFGEEKFDIKNAVDSYQNIFGD
ncbi:MAG: glycosyltransferase family 4 protein [Candidatus Nanohalobium sp.]